MDEKGKEDRHIVGQELSSRQDARIKALPILLGCLKHLRPPKQVVMDAGLKKAHWQVSIK